MEKKGKWRKEERKRGKRKREKKSKRKKRGRTRSKMVGTIWIGKRKKIEWNETTKIWSSIYENDRDGMGKKKRKESKWTRKEI